MSIDPTLQAQYLEALRALADHPVHGTVVDRETRLALAETDILEADPPDGDGIDSVLMTALGLPAPYSQQGVDRRLTQLRDEGEAEDGFAEWVYNATRDEYDRRIKIATARLALVVALDAVEQAVADATSNLDALEELLDLDIISPRRNGRGVKFIQIEQALGQVRIGAAAAQQLAPDPERQDG